MLVFGVVLVIGVGYAGTSLLHDLSFVHNESILPYVLLGSRSWSPSASSSSTDSTTPPTLWPRSSTRTRSSLTSRWSGPASGNSPRAFLFRIRGLRHRHAACPSNSFFKSGAAPDSPMVFALLIAAIIWNLGTWWLRPASLQFAHPDRAGDGVSIANQLLERQKREPVGYRLGSSRQSIGRRCCSRRVFGFMLCGLLIYVSKALIKYPGTLHCASKLSSRRSFYIRARSVLTCTGVSFFMDRTTARKVWA